MLSSGFDPVAQGWTLAPYCDFTPDAACDLADINQMFQAGNLVTGVTTSGSTDRLDLVDNDTLDAVRHHGVARAGSYRKRPRFTLPAWRHRT